MIQDFFKTIENDIEILRYPSQLPKNKENNQKVNRSGIRVIAALGILLGTLRIGISLVKGQGILWGLSGVAVCLISRDIFVICNNHENLLLNSIKEAGKVVFTGIKNLFTGKENHDNKFDLYTLLARGTLFPSFWSGVLKDLDKNEAISTA